MLAEALAMCRAHRAALVGCQGRPPGPFASFLSRILEAGVEVRFCDLPQIEGPTGRFLLQSMMAVAELEAGMISARTKAALAATKARGKKLGGFRGRAGTAEDTARARAARTLKATEQARSIAPIIDRVDPDQTASLRGIARALNDEGVPTRSGAGDVDRRHSGAPTPEARTALSIRGSDFIRWVPLIMHGLLKSDGVTRALIRDPRIR